MAPYIRLCTNQISSEQIRSEQISFESSTLVAGSSTPFINYDQLVGIEVDTLNLLSRELASKGADQIPEQRKDGGKTLNPYFPRSLSSGVSSWLRCRQPLRDVGCFI